MAAKVVEANRHILEAKKRMRKQQILKAQPLQIMNFLQTQKEVKGILYLLTVMLLNHVRHTVSYNKALQI